MDIATKVGYDRTLVNTAENGINLFDKLNHRLIEGVVAFVFLTSEGRERQAYGTLKQELMPSVVVSDIEAVRRMAAAFALGASEDKEKARAGMGAFHSKWVDAEALRKEKIQEASKKGIQPLHAYWDLEKQAFRTFKPENLIAVF